MTDQVKTGSPREALREELEATRQAYHELLASIPDDAWNRPTANPKWNVRQMMFHITMAPRFLPADIAMLRRGRTPTVPSWLFNLVNEALTGFAGKRQTRASLAAEYDKRHAIVMKLLDAIRPHEWSLSAKYPNINRNLRGTQSIASMFHYLTVHFEEHAADVRRALRAGKSPNGHAPAATGHEQRKPGPFLTFLFRVPLVLYRLGLGWLLGGRFLLLQHTGRKSGLQRQTVLEVAGHDRETDTYYIASGFGRGSQWFKNVQANPEVTIQVGARRIDATADVLDPQASGQKMVEYARQHPIAARELAGVLGFEVDGTEQRYREIAREFLPFVALRPRRVLQEKPAPKQIVAPLILLLGLLLPLVARLRRRS